MKRNFVSVARFLKDRFPEIVIEGGEYPVPPLAEFLGNVVAAVQLSAMAWAVMGGDAFFRLLGFTAQQRPQWSYNVEQNSMQYSILIFLVIPQFVQRFRTSGAFELILDDEKEIWSKLTAGRFPTQEELIGGLQAAGLQMANTASQ